MSSAGVGGESDPYPEIPGAISHQKLTGTPTNANVEMFPTVAGRAHGPQQQMSNSSASQNGIPIQESDAKSDASFDPLFDDEPDPDGEGDNHSAPDGGVGSLTAISHKESVSPGLAVPDGVASDATSQPQQTARSSQNSVAPPKNAPPLLGAENSCTLSPDILMISAIDGQVMLWDKRVNTPGKGVGRLWLSEKTPPWCVSVRTRNFGIDRQTGQHIRRHAGRQMDRISTWGDGTGRWMCGMCGNWGAVDRGARLGCSRVCGIRRVLGWCRVLCRFLMVATLRGGCLRTCDQQG